MALIRDRCARCNGIQYRTYTAGVDPISQADARVLCDPCKEVVPGFLELQPEPEPEQPKRKPRGRR